MNQLEAAKGGPTGQSRITVFKKTVQKTFNTDRIQGFSGDDHFLKFSDQKKSGIHGLFATDL